MEKKRPKRRKDKYNPYTICQVGKKYYIKFHDSQKQKICLEVNKELFEVFDSFELEDIKQLNTYDRHMEHSTVYESTLERRSQRIKESSEETAVRNILFQELHRAIALLPEIQRRRIMYYYFEDLTYEQIAEIENCSFQAVAKSIKTAEEKLKKFLE